MRVEVLTVGTELLLGQIVNTNSTMIAQKLAENGIDSYHHTSVGDNHRRIVSAIREALARSDGLIICGGLGPTQDDITREAIAEVMGVDLVLDDKIVRGIREMFTSRGREMPENNLRQAQVPKGATPISQRRGTAPGLICPLGHKVIYAAPGVPYELEEMLERAIIPDLLARSGFTSTIASRVLRTWGLSESRLAEVVSPRFEALEESSGVTIAFLASGIEGIKVRVTAKAESHSAAREMLDKEESELRLLLGDHIFGVNGETMEFAVGALLKGAGLSLAVGESLTGGMVSSRIVSIPGASSFFRGGLVSYATEAKQKILQVGKHPVISEETAIEMAKGVADLFDASVGLGITGVAGPAKQEEREVGTVCIGIFLRGVGHSRTVKLPGDRERIRLYSVISALDYLRLLLLDSPRAGSTATL